jgi:mRNA interferase RelE/StbE
MKVELEEQVVTFLRSLPPEPRKALRRALAELEQERGDIRALEGELQDYYRLRVLRYRVIFRYHIARRKRTIRCIYAAPRNLIYEVFAQELRRILG